MRLSTLIAGFLGLFKADENVPRIVGRAKTRDVAFTYRMGAGFPGDLTRISAAMIEAILPDATTPPDQYGQLGILDAGSHNFRPPYSEANTTASAYGAVVRPFPLTGNSTTPTIGNATPPTDQPIDVLRQGYFLAQLDAAGIAAPSVKGGTVYMHVAATSGSHTKGQLETTGTANTVTFSNVTFMGPPDSTGVVECFIDQ